jgi:hypothetical protein
VGRLWQGYDWTTGSRRSIWKFNLLEGRTYVAHALELDVSSCAGSQDRAIRNLKEAVRFFLEEAEKMGTLEQILEEADYSG